MQEELTRRSFLGAGTKVAAGSALAGGLLAQPQKAVAQNDKIVVGLIGCGGMGRANLRQFMKNPDVQVAALCDVDTTHLDGALTDVEKAGNQKKPDTYKDFRALIDRKDINAVIVGTPDHWHALPTIYACQAGKEVYCEKPLGFSVGECRAMLNAARKYNRVVQTGNWQRSSQHMMDAVDLVKSGKLGKISVTRAWMVRNMPGIGNPPDGNPPPELDYEMWLGPAPKQPYNPNRSHYNFRWFYDYAGALMTDWGIHLNDVVLWAMGTPQPIAVTAVGGKFVLDNDNRDTPDTLIATFQFPNFVHQWEHREGNGRPMDGGPQGHGIEFIGTNGTLIVDRGGWKVFAETEGKEKTPRIAEQSVPAKGGLPEHIRDFLDCIKSRQQCRADFEISANTTSICHLGNVAYLAGKKIFWDPATQKLVNAPMNGGSRPSDDRAANQIALVEREYRRPWSIDRSLMRVASAS